MPKEPGRIPWDEPLAYYLTWSCYGTWLPGDERGWVEKPGAFRTPDPDREAAARQLMTEPALTLDTCQRAVVERTITDHCRIRGWTLHAVNCRTRHVHVVVTAPGRKPDMVMEQFKAWCTRRLKERDQARGPAGEPLRTNWWTQGGSKRWLNDTTSLDEAVHYVLECQGDPTPHDLDSSADTRQA
jgi:REP element-mobilizing transposase RayT